MPATVFVSTPSRLHFGLLRFEQAESLSYGGLGMMIDRPRVELQLAVADEWSVVGPASNQARFYAERTLEFMPESQKPRALSIRVHADIPTTTGSGSGTQLALAVAAGIRQLAGLPSKTDAEKLARVAGRGARSAVGSHGFIHGGLIWEKGRSSDQWLAPLTARVAVPEQWRVVLATPASRPGLSGPSERDAFDALPPVPQDITKQLELIAEERILPAARQADFDEFGAGVYEYGRLAGECFASVQGGPYASDEISNCVATIRALGVRGVGQSSWGPTVFAIVQSKGDAASLVSALNDQSPRTAAELAVARPDNGGAIVDATWNASREIVDGASRTDSAP